MFKCAKTTVLIADTTVDCVLHPWFSWNLEDSQRGLLWSGFALIPVTLVMIIPSLSSVRLGFSTESQPVCGSLRGLGLTLVFNKHLCLQRLIYSSITTCSNHLRIPKMVIEVKRIHTDNFANAHSNVRQPRLTELSFDFTTCLFFTLSSVIVDILFFRLKSMPHRVLRCSELWRHPQVYMSR